MEKGTVCLVFNVEEQVDSLLDAVLQKKTYSAEGKTCVKIGEDTVVYNPSFRLYLTSKRQRIVFPSRLQSYLTLVNFAPVPAGLEDHLLRIVVGKERPELRQKTEANIMIIKLLRINIIIYIMI